MNVIEILTFLGLTNACIALFLPYGTNSGDRIIQMIGDGDDESHLVQTQSSIKFWNTMRTNFYVSNFLLLFLHNVTPALIFYFCRKIDIE